MERIKLRRSFKLTDFTNYNSDYFFDLETEFDILIESKFSEKIVDKIYDDMYLTNSLSDHEGTIEEQLRKEFYEKTT